MKSETPLNTTILMKQAVSSNDFEQFKSLYTEERQSSVNKETYEIIKVMTTTQTDFKNYELLTFENGEMVLVHLTHSQDGKVEIQDVIFAPKEMKILFNEKSLAKKS